MASVIDRPTADARFCVSGGNGLGAPFRGVSTDDAFRDALGHAISVREINATEGMDAPFDVTVFRDNVLIGVVTYRPPDPPIVVRLDSYLRPVRPEYPTNTNRIGDYEFFGPTDPDRPDLWERIRELVGMGRIDRIKAMDSRNGAQTDVAVGPDGRGDAVVIYRCPDSPDGPESLTLLWIDCLIARTEAAADAVAEMLARTVLSWGFDLQDDREPPARLHLSPRGDADAVKRIHAAMMRIAV